MNEGTRHLPGKLDTELGKRIRAVDDSFNFALDDMELEIVSPAGSLARRYATADVLVGTSKSRPAEGFVRCSKEGACATGRSCDSASGYGRCSSGRRDKFSTYSGHAASRSTSCPVPRHEHVNRHRHVCISRTRACIAPNCAGRDSCGECRRTHQPITTGIKRYTTSQYSYSQGDKGPTPSVPTIGTANSKA
jgi:hypothetical protein